jgi:hypothetical protein
MRVPKSLHRRLAERAKAEGVSLNTLAVTLLAKASAGAGMTANGQHDRPTGAATRAAAADRASRRSKAIS